MTRPVRARIDLQALRHNLSIARQAAAGSRVMAVIKADGYGHGLVPVAQALADADAFAVASLEEALALRDAGIERPVLLLEGLFEAAELEAAVANRLWLVVHAEHQLRWLEDAAPDGALHVWLKLDTGMHRLGVAPDHAAEFHRRLLAIPAVRRGSLALMSHLACADDPDSACTDRQLDTFVQLTDGLQGRRSLANSAALLTRPQTRFDWVRPGIMLYGASPLTAGKIVQQPLQPVMTFRTGLIAVARRRKGDSIGYGCSWTCPEDMPVGVAAAGYGDGYPRHAPPGTPVLVNGRRAALAGRVSMDMICIDLRGAPDARVGDPVVLWGEGLAADEVARHAGTIAYELLCGVTARVAREYAG